MEEDTDDFEYDITFPIRRTGRLDDAAQSVADLEDLEFDEDYNGLEPVVFLLGWAGCKDKYLAKYSEFYEQKGCV